MQCQITAASADEAPIEMPLESAAQNHQVFAFIENSGNVTSAQLAKHMGLSQRRVREILNELVLDGFVVKEGNYRHAKYTLKK